MNKDYFILLLMVFMSPVVLFAQTGRISGTIKDESTSALLTGVSVAVVGGSQATSSDFEGDYALELAPGTYTLVFSYVGYNAKQITDVKVTQGEAAIVDVNLSSSADQLEEVVVSVSARKNTEQSVLNMQKSAGVVMDGLSSQAMQRTGSSNVASAAKAVPGVSVQEGKYLYVRGLGDRYTKSILNGMDIPGLDPDKNTVQMDIFPTNVLENVVVSKTASAELPADFTGGVIDIVTKDIPAQKQVGVSFSLGYNPNMHFQDNFTTYQGSGTDFLGFDNGNRARPVSSRYEIPNRLREPETVEQITKAFNPLLGAERKTNYLPDMSLGLDFSNQYDLWNNKLGVIGVLSYKRTTNFFEGYQDGIYQLPNQTMESPELRADQTAIGDMSTQNALLSGMLGLNYKTNRSKYSLNMLHIQNGESRAAIFNQTVRIRNSANMYKNLLDYSQRSISNVLLSGRHSNEEADFITEWKVSPSLVRVHDKDVRLTTLRREPDGSYRITTDTGPPRRIWRSLDEVNAVAKVDFTKRLQWFDNDAAFKFGGLYSYKQRDYIISNYDVGATSLDVDFSNLDLNQILAPENVYDAEEDAGFFVTGEFQPSNMFDAKQLTASAYASVEFHPFDKLRTIVGLRAEQYTTFFTGENVNNEVFNNEKTIDKLDLFPSLNMIYSPLENHNLRFSYSRTTARPSFKELSVVQILDPLNDTWFLGNLDLVPAYINNLDLRYEIYGDHAQMFAISGFYKKFKDPIEIQLFTDSDQLNFTPRNSGDANVFGVEIETRKNFEFVSYDLRHVSVNLNASLVHSEIQMGENEYNSRVSFAREGQTIERTRPLQGQSPYLINAGLSYNNSENGWEGGLFYNVQGKTLQLIGFTRNPDVYAKPFNSLNLNVSKKLGSTGLKGGTVTLKVDNLLDSKRLSVHEAFMASDQIFSERLMRRTFSIGYNYNF